MYCRYRPRARQQASDPQSLWVWPGCRVVGAGGKVAKGQICHVVSYTPDLVELDIGTKLLPDELVRAIRPGHCLVFAGCQGLTLEGLVRIETGNSPHLTIKHLYVGCSRATSHTLLEVT